MEVLLTAFVIMVVFGILAATFGADSRPGDETPWWPGSRSESEYPQHHA